MEVVYIALLTILAAGVGTLTGFGTSTIMVPVLVSFFPLPQTLFLVGIIHWFGDIWKMGLFKRGLRWKLIFLFGVPGVLLTFLGAHLVFSISQTLLSQVLGGFLLAYVLFLFVKPGFKIKRSNASALTGGGIYGFFAGIFGVGGALRGAFLSAFDLPKGVYIATAGAIGFAVDSVRLTTYFLEGSRLPSSLLWGLLAFVPASFLGAWIAKKVVGKIPQDRFRQVVALFLLFFALKLLVFP